MRPYYLLLSGLFLLLSSLSLEAQDQKWEGSLLLGTSNYFGDLIEKNGQTLKQSNLAYGLLVKRKINQNVGVRLGISSGQLDITDADNDNEEYQARGFSFENRLTELSLTGEWEPLGSNRFPGGKKFNKILSPYVFAGVGLAFSNPETNFNERESVGVTADQNEDTQKSVFTIPFGVGIRYDVTRKINVGLELGFRATTDDYLDGVSQAGNPDRNDWFAFSGITVSTRFGTTDSDGDGVADENDKCPNTAGLSSVGGCPDTDLDGIADSKDACPEIAGEEKFNGCPDSDGDGVADNQDNCPDEPGERRFRGCPDTDGDGVADPVDVCPTVEGLVSLDGCPDKDGDGITDADDACPDLAGIEAANGCPDSDGDGIIDPQDKCPHNAGTSTYGGCPDTDGDGIGDGDDACPSNVGPASNNGCPLVSDEDLATLELAMRNVRFRTGSDEILTQSYGILDEVAEVMARYPNYDIKMSGYTDNVGNDLTNQELSKRRAQSCFQYLLVKGVDRRRMSHAGYGETNPIADNKTPQGRATNRRVEFELILRQ